MIGFSFAVFGWNVIWIIEDIRKHRSFFDRYNIRKNGWFAMMVWVYLLLGIICLFFT